jgi:putative acetyltransferase
MINIRRLRPSDVPAVKRIINTVAYNIFGFDGTQEDSLRHYEDLGAFQDLEDVKANYFEMGGTFLVAVKEGKVIGSGALRRLDKRTAELKRLWLLEDYQGKGIGWRLMTALIAFARQQGYTRIRLQTRPEQARAVEFYRKAGFTEIPCYNEEKSEISMEKRISEDP